ncbi:MAG: hypothetical protein AAF443_08975 [Chlamydiota bacterium]
MRAKQGKMTMIRLVYLFLFVVVFYLKPLVSLEVAPQTAALIAQKIWKNECNESVSGLTHWNKGEKFPSMGIGHFIWYPEGVEDCFEQTFPQLLSFFKSQGAVLPSWLDKTEGCPWKSREDFYRDIHSPQMRDLRQLLFDYRDLQAQFMIKRLETVLSEICTCLPEEERAKISFLIHQLISAPNGLYALIDYLNFKGSGLSSEESYQGHRWGLLQVLQQMAARPIVNDFVEAGEKVLRARVEHAPPEKNAEAHWLPGWINRLNTYLDQ